ncbi:MAG TPA: helix-turn-helix domain-containing protein [Pirellulales bacterium]|nr:helix-turn-helix domain-containing protein [Pirellulales bacterium]
MQPDNLAQIEETYQHFLGIAGDPQAAALLVHSAYLAGQQPAAASDAPLTIKEAADVMGIGVRTVYSLVAAGKLRHSRFGAGRGTIRISREAIAECQRAAEPVKETPRDLKYLARVAGRPI